MTCRHHGPNLGETTPCCLHEAERGGSVVLTIAQLHELIAREVADIRFMLGDQGHWLDDILYGYEHQLQHCTDNASCRLLQRVAEIKAVADAR